MSYTPREGSYEELVVWQKSISFVKAVYQLTKNFPSDEKYGLMSQMRRAAVLIPSNIAEGHARHTTQEYIRFISIAEGSLAELSTQIIISVELEYCKLTDTEELTQNLDEIRRMLNGLRGTLTAKAK